MSETPDDPVRSVTTTDELFALILAGEGRRQTLFERVAEHARVLDARIVLAVLASGVGSRELIRNPALPEGAASMIALWEINRLATQTSESERAQAADVLEYAFAHSLVPVTDKSYLRTLAFVTRKRRVQAQLDAAQALVLHPEAPPAALEAAFKLVRENPTSTLIGAHVITHAHAPAELIAEWSSVVPAWTRLQRQETNMLLDCDRTRLHPDMRTAFARLAERVRMSALFERMACDDMDDCVEHARRILATSLIAEPLRQNGTRIMQDLTENERLSLFEHEDRDVRLLAIALLKGVEVV